MTGILFGSLGWDGGIKKFSKSFAFKELGKLFREGRVWNMKEQCNKTHGFI